MKQTAGKKAWLTQKQVEKLYQDPVVAAAIVKSRQADENTWRCNPECPDLVQARQFLCMVEDYQLELLENKHDRGMAMEAEADREGAKPYAQRLQEGHHNC